MEITGVEDDKKAKRAGMEQLANELSKPFAPFDIEWRISQAGAKNGKCWARVLAYVTNRAIMQRLDTVCGIDNWKNEFVELDGAFMCGLSVRLHGEWITKWDGAQKTNIEATKGGISGSMKRAAVQWGIGRYLYGLEEAFAEVTESGRFRQSAKTKGEQWQQYPAFRWNPPQLPDWALPKGAPS